jgi:hypothetical protein
MPTPSAPKCGGIMYGNETTVFIIWDPPEDDGGATITTYMLSLTPDGQPTVNHLTNTPRSSYTLDNLVHGINVNATVKASNDGGQTYGPEFVFPVIVPLAAPTSPPRFPSAVADGHGIATISWQPPETPPEGAGYYLVMSVSSNPSDISIGYTTSDMSELSATITSLNPQSEYYFTIQIINQVGRTELVSTNTIVFPPEPAPTAAEPTRETIEPAAETIEPAAETIDATQFDAVPMAPPITEEEPLPEGYTEAPAEVPPEEATTEAPAEAPHPTE